MKNALPKPANQSGTTHKIPEFIISNPAGIIVQPTIAVPPAFKVPAQQKKISKNRFKRTFHGIIAGDKKTTELFESIKSIADYHFPVHISGETGTGKELVAKAIHNESQRRKGPFVPVNCGALPEGLVESELFGHVKGSFSGAVANKQGRFELADGGTLFLDEVSELSKNAQVKLLRVLQEGIVEKVGSTESRKVDVRILSATNKRLKDEMLKGHFRNDLYYRLNVFPISLPPLCERAGDILPLAIHFLETICQQYNKELPVLSNAVRDIFHTYSWPGNVRELQNVICYAIIKSSAGLITPDCLPLEFSSVNAPLTEYQPPGRLSFDAVKDALILSGWNKTRAAKKLNVGRATLYRFLEKNSRLLKYKKV